MKKVLIFSLVYYPRFVGGAEIAIKEITDRISSEEIEFHMVTLRFDSTLPEVEQMGNVLVHRIGFTKSSPTVLDLKKLPLYLNKFIFQFSAAIKASSLHQRYKYDAIWAVMAHSTGVPAGLFKTSHSGVSYALTLQEGDPIEYIKRKMRVVYPLFVRGFRKADIVQAISVYLGGWARAMGFRGPLEIIPNGVDIKLFSQEFSQEELDEMRRYLDKKENDIYLITTSRLVKKNACDDVVRALTLLPSNISFLILGTGPDEGMLYQLAKELSVADRIQFLRHIDHSIMPKYLKVSDIFIRPSLSEGMGSSFVEAMAAGLPVIATQEGGIADFLFDPERNPDKKPTGRAVEPRDPEGIVRAVRWYIEHPDETRRIIANAKELVFSKYDWDIVAKDMKEKVFDRLSTL